MNAIAALKTPIGWMQITASEWGIADVRFVPKAPKTVRNAPAAAQSHAKRAQTQLTEYFSGKRRAFDLSVDTEGTAFQHKVWKALLRTPSGAVTSYAALAKKAGYPKAARAVGSAMRVNPLCIIVPCHRVLPASSKGNRAHPGTYAGGAKRKIWLLDHEA